MNRHWKRAAGIAAVMLAVSSGAFFAGRAFAIGIPTTNALVYSGTLEDSNGAPLTGVHTIEVRLWGASVGGTSPLCTTGPQQVTLTNGRFSISMPDACTAQIKANPDTYVEVLDGSTSLGRSKVGAVPYAVEAGHATSAAALDTLAPTDVQKVVTGSCAVGSYIRAIAANGTVTCQSDSNTTYTGASGVVVSGTTISTDTGFVQRRVSGSCAAGTYVRAIAADGSVTCQQDVDTDTNTTYGAGDGLALSGTTFSVNLPYYVSPAITSTSATQVYQITPKAYRFCALKSFDLLGYNDPNTHRYCNVDPQSDGTWVLWVRAAASNTLSCSMVCF